MNVLSLFSFVVFAAETIISPLPDDGIAFPTPTSTLQISFGQLLDYTQSEVLGEKTEIIPTPPPAGGLRPHRKSNYTIALLGDSMIDTLGPDAPHLKDYLQKLYPGVTFRILNYGVGGENIESGIHRITNEYTYLGEVKPPLVTQNPDIIIVESFAYNPFIEPENEVDRHWMAMAKIIDMLKSNVPNSKIAIASTIAPNANIFGDGVLNWDQQLKNEKVVRINALLENTIKFAKSQHLPLADIYTVSNGKTEYINPGDHIHYSDAGRDLFGRIVANTIVNAGLLE